MSPLSINDPSSFSYCSYMIWKESPFQISLWKSTWKPYNRANSIIVFAFIPNLIAVLYKLFCIIPSLKIITLVKFFSIIFELKFAMFVSLLKIASLFLSISILNSIILTWSFLSILKNNFWLSFKDLISFSFFIFSKTIFFSVLGILILSKIFS